MMLSGLSIVNRSLENDKMLNQIPYSISYEELLNFYKESGADAVLTDSPIDRFNQAACLEKKQSKK